jgi:hypothetical protein
MQQARAARLGRISGEFACNQLKEAIARRRRQGRCQRGKHIHFVIGEAKRRHEASLAPAQAARYTQTA